MSCKVCKKAFSGEERCVCCCMCDQMQHMKCASLTPKGVDIIENNNGVRWFCPECTTLNRNICSTYRATRKIFLDTSRELAAMQEKLSNYEKLFTSNKLLELAVNSTAGAASEKKAVTANPPTSFPPLQAPGVASLDSDNDLIILSPVPPTIVEHPPHKATRSAAAKAAKGAVPKIIPSLTMLKYGLSN